MIICRLEYSLSNLPVTNVKLKRKKRENLYVCMFEFPFIVMSSYCLFITRMIPLDLYFMISQQLNTCSYQTKRKGKRKGPTFGCPSILYMLRNARGWSKRIG